MSKRRMSPACCDTTRQLFIEELKRTSPTTSPADCTDDPTARRPDGSTLNTNHSAAQGHGSSGLAHPWRTGASRVPSGRLSHAGEGSVQLRGCTLQSENISRSCGKPPGHNLVLHEVCRIDRQESPCNTSPAPQQIRTIVHAPPALTDSPALVRNL
jgi:hypothetical protein